MIKIAIASGKGGTGKTFLSTNLFRIMEQSGLGVTLIDCDAEVPNAAVFIKRKRLKEVPTRMFCPEIDTGQCTLCSLCADHCKFHAITCIPAMHYIKVLPDLCHSCGVCLHDCPSGAIRTSWKEVGSITTYGQPGHPELIEARIREGIHSPVACIREAVRQGEQTGADYLIMDAPPGCSCPFVNTVMDADKVVLVSEPTPFGLSDLKHTVQVLRELGKSFFVVINRSDLGNRQMKSYLTAEGIGLLAEIPYSEQIASTYSKGELAVDKDPEIKRLFTHLMEEIIQHESSNH